jgi:protein-disulfide isomerase
MRQDVPDVKREHKSVEIGMNKILQGFFVLAIAALFGIWQPGEALSQADADVQADIRSNIEETLAAHPDLILDVLREHPVELVEILEQAVQAKREADQQKQEEDDLAQRRDPEIFANRPMRGNPEAEITIVEYSDFQCPYCSTATANLKDLMSGADGDDIRLVFKHLPLNPVSRDLAMAFEAVALQDAEAAWKLHDALFSNQPGLRNGAEDVLNSVIGELDIDQERFARDRESEELAALIQQDMEEARKFGFSGTPMFLVNGIPVRGAVPVQEFQRIIDLARTTPAKTATQE